MNGTGILLVPVTAMVVAMAVIVLLSRHATRLGLIDRPAARKVHTHAVPRVGGLGIAVGVAAPVFVLMEPAGLTAAYLSGCLILAAFGVWDDCRDVGHYTKFFGQIAAAVLLVVGGGVYATRLPVLGAGALPETILIGLTVIAVVGMINAINHSDGLDGLAGGEALLSLGGVLVIAYLAGAGETAILAAALVGAIFGFLRYNTYPAMVFMGDVGSQIIGYTLALLLLLIAGPPQAGISPATVLLLTGLPAADIAVVLYKRVRGGMNWFRATRNHVHHRLLERGLSHREAVLTIYGIQLVMVASGVYLRSSPDWLILTCYACCLVVVFGGLQALEKRGWQRPDSQWLGAWDLSDAGRLRRAMVVLPRRFLQLAVPTYLLVMSLRLPWVPWDFAVTSLAVALALSLAMVAGVSQSGIIARLTLYSVVGFVIYLSYSAGSAAPEWLAVARPIFFASVAVAVVLTLRYSPRRRRTEFLLTPLDYLIGVGLLACLGASNGGLLPWTTTAAAVELTVLFYACEVLFVERGPRGQSLRYSTLASALVLGLRGLF